MRTLVLVALLAGTAMSGCLEGFGVGLPFHEVQIHARVVHGANQTSWSDETRFVVEMPHLRTQKQPPAQPGGGQVFALAQPDLDGAYIELRMQAEGDLGGFEAEWTIDRMGDGRGDHEFTLPADQVLRVQAEVGRHHIYGLVGKGLKIDAVENDARVDIEVHWTAQSTVYPFRTQGSQAPPDYDQMADLYGLIAPVDGARLTATTNYRGSYGAGNGTDVDLEAYPTGSPDEGECSGQSSTVVSPSAASEELTLHVRFAGNVTVRVGAVTPACDPDSFYHNTGPVPYDLDVLLHYSP